MTKIIELTDLVITNIAINYVDQNVRVSFDLVDSNGEIWNRGAAFFWVTMPPEPRDVDFQLPSAYFPTLLGLRDDADTALTDRLLV